MIVNGRLFEEGQQEDDVSGARGLAVRGAGCRIKGIYTSRRKVTEHVVVVVKCEPRLF